MTAPAPAPAGAGPAAPPGPQDPTQRFGVRADAYARARPAYAPELVGELSRALGLTPDAAIVDLGCGTGISCEPFLREGFKVLGVEPNAQMRTHAVERLAAHGGFSARDARAESTGLPDASADLIIAAQAFHWFDVAATRAEALRILRRPALAALIWNDRREEGSAFARGYESLLREFSPAYLELRHRHGRLDRVEQFFAGRRWRTLSLAHGDRLDFALLADRVNSASYMPPPGDPRHGPMMRSLRALFDSTQEDGTVAMDFETRVLFGTLEPPA